MKDKRHHPDRYEILEGDEWENDQGPTGWCAISDEAGGIIAYAQDIETAELILQALQAR
jgi:hypothetical protein